MRLEINSDKIKKLESDLGALSSRALPYATLATVNEAAFKAQGFARGNVREQMTNRNKFTQQSIRVNKAHGTRIEAQAAIVGSTAGYMETQEFGGTKSKQGAQGVDIATSYASGEGMAAKPRKRLPRKPNRLMSIKLQHKKKKGANQAQQNLIAIREAAAGSDKFVFLDLGKRKGIFRVTGKGKRAKLKMVHDLTSDSVRIPREAWLLPAVNETKKHIPDIYAAKLQDQIDRQKLFKT